MIRVTALWLFVFALAWYARKDWYVSLCGLILTMAVIEHPDVPKTMFGIQGLNFWNLLLAVIVWIWWRARAREGLTWDMPRFVTVMLVVYLAVVLVSFARMMVDRTYVYDSTASLISEYLVNTLKWVVPGLLLYDGCRSRNRFYLAVGSVLSVYVLLALYIVKWMPIGLLTDAEALEQRALKILVNEIGYHRVNMSMMLAGAGWAVFAARFLAPQWPTRVLIVAMAGVIAYAQALTGGRMGYVTWAVVGLLLCLIRGRALLALAPVIVLTIATLIPAARDRLLQGFDARTSEYASLTNNHLGDPFDLDRSGPDVHTITAGRTRIWPYVLARIGEAPLLGYGRLAMRRIGLVTLLDASLGEAFEHPHNAYLELLLDSGVVGLIGVLPFYLFVIGTAFRLYADSRSAVFVAAGGVAAAMTLSMLVAGLGSQTFYPREGAVGMWCAIGLMLRVWVERRRALADSPERAVVRTRRTARGARWRAPGTAAARRRVVPAAAPGIGDLDQRLWAHA